MEKTVLCISHDGLCRAFILCGLLQKVLGEFSVEYAGVCAGSAGQPIHQLTLRCLQEHGVKLPGTDYRGRCVTELQGRNIFHIICIDDFVAREVSRHFPSCPTTLVAEKFGQAPDPWGKAMHAYIDCANFMRYVSTRVAKEIRESAESASTQPP